MDDLFFRQFQRDRRRTVPPRPSARSVRSNATSSARARRPGPGSVRVSIGPMIARSPVFGNPLRVFLSARKADIMRDRVPRRPLKMPKIDILDQIARRLRIHSLKMTARAGSGHPTTCLSAADLVACLFFDEMRYDLRDAGNPANDEFVLSKGHAAPILWAAYAEAGILPRRISIPEEDHERPRRPSDAADEVDQGGDRLPGPGPVGRRGDGPGPEAHEVQGQDLRPHGGRGMRRRLGLGGRQRGRELRPSVTCAPSSMSTASASPAGRCTTTTRPPTPASSGRSAGTPSPWTAIISGRSWKRFPASGRRACRPSSWPGPSRARASPSSRT